MRRLSLATAADGRSMHLRVMSLAFGGPNADLEPLFRQDYFRGSLVHVRVALILGTLMYGAYGVLDHLMFPLDQRALWSIRAAVCPVIALGAVATSRPWFERWMQPMLALVMSICGGSVIWMSVIAPAPASYQYWTGLVVVLLFSYAFVRIRFLWAMLAGIAIGTSYFIATIALTDIPHATLMSNGFFLVTFNLVGMASCYSIERASRRSFFLRHLLAQEQANVREANQLLESRVAARTSELTSANAQLQREMAERHRAEQDRLQLEQKLKQAEKLETIGKLAAGVAHDLNNLLVGLVTAPEVLLMDLPESDPMHRDLVDIRDSGQRAAAIVSDLLALSRQGTPERAVVKLNGVIEAYVRSPECRVLKANHPKVELEVALEGSLLNVLGSRVQLSKVVMNLLHNAFEANLVGGSVKLATCNRYLDGPKDGFEPIPEGEYVVLKVSDTGTGIAKEDLSRIFEPFFTKKKLGRSGTGLGMTLIGSAVKEHRGFLDLSTAEGEGTTFELYFPATREEVMAAEPPARLEDCRGTERVLIVDDVFEQRRVATNMLRKLGYDVHAVDSGEAALSHLQTSSADILVLDMIMEPGIDGCETYRRILTQCPGQRAIIATGFSSSERVEEALRLGAGEYIQKPYTLERLARALRRELTKPADAVRASAG
ncbi:MAG: response regulator [Kofleriaceae bacterium]